MKRVAITAMAAVALAGCSAPNGASQEDGRAAADATVRAKPLTQLRIAIAADATKPCAQKAADWPDAQRDYVRHLTARLEIPVTLCAMASREETAEALAGGAVDMGLLDREAYLPVKTAVRPILTERIPVDLGRSLAVVAVTEQSPLRALADADRATIILSRANQPMLEGVKRTMKAVGTPAETIGAAMVLDDAAAALTALRAGRGDAVVLSAAEWFRFCRGDKKAENPCEGLREIWRGRRPADQAWSVRRDIPLESHARIVGIHVALFQEMPHIARWLAPRTTEIEPAEATALDPAR